MKPIYPFHAKQESFKIEIGCQQVIAENEYVRCVHDLARGGSLSEAVIRYGSGKNLFAQPQGFAIGLIVNHARYHVYQPTKAAVTQQDSDQGPVLTFTSHMADAEGKPLPGVTFIMTVTYTPWGELLFEPTFHCARRIQDLGMIQISSLHPAAHMDTLGVIPSLVEMDYPYGGGSNVHWYHLKPNNYTTFQSRWLPQSMLVFKRGLEGFQIIQGDDRDQWLNIGGALPGFQMGHVKWNNKNSCYDLRFSALDALREGQYLEGDMTFAFSLAFPFVRKNIVPLSPCSGNILHYERDFEHRWPTDDDLQRLQDAGVTLMRFHNDGNTYNNGIFWRDAVYPPYGPEDMARLDDLLRRAHEHGIAVSPYFSVHEYHPDAPGFAENSPHWGRLADKHDHIIGNNGPNGYYGFQMCLNSGWLNMRRDTIEQVISNHDFDGLYFDGCVGAECVNPEHGGWHRDFRRLMDLITWSHRRVGDREPLYIHLTANPNLPVNNLTSLAIVEEAGGELFTPDMFTPECHFMNICPREVCCMLPMDAPEADHRRYALAALLYHATVSSNLKPYTDFYREYRSILEKTTHYQRHAAPGEGICSARNPKVGMAAYWIPKAKEHLFFFVNLTEETIETDYGFDNGEFAEDGTVTLPPLALVARS